MLGPLEHQVFEQVREARATRHLVLRADVVPHVHRDNRHAVIFVDDDVEAVGESGLGERDAHGQLTGISGMARRENDAIETCCATRSAAEKRARDDGASGSLMTMGTPVSPPVRTGA